MRRYIIGLPALIEIRMMTPDRHGTTGGFFRRILGRILKNLLASMVNVALQRHLAGSLSLAELDNHGSWNSIISPSMLEGVLIVLVAQLFEAKVQFVADLFNGHVWRPFCRALPLLRPRQAFAEAAVYHLDRTAMWKAFEGVRMQIKASPRPVRESPVPERPS